MSELRALIFDVDGTLADTERDGHRLAFNKAFADAGLDWDWSVDLYGKLLAMAGGKERMRHYLKTMRPAVKLPNNADATIIALHRSKTRHYTQLLESGHIPLRPGVRRLLDEARAEGVRLAIATTTTPVNVQALLENTLGKESLDWFEVIAAGDIVPAKKPASDIYEYVLEKMDLSADDCIAFEDSANGIRSSASAKLRTIITTNDYTREHDFNAAMLVLDTLGEPDEPFAVQSGNAHDASYVNIALLRKLLQD